MQAGLQPCTRLRSLKQVRIKTSELQKQKRGHQEVPKRRAKGERGDEPHQQMRRSLQMRMTHQMSSMLEWRKSHFHPAESDRNPCFQNSKGRTEAGCSNAPALGPTRSGAVSVCKYLMSGSGRQPTAPFFDFKP